MKRKKKKEKHKELKWLRYRKCAIAQSIKTDCDCAISYFKCSLYHWINQISVTLCRIVFVLFGCLQFKVFRLRIAVHNNTRHLEMCTSGVCKTKNEIISITKYSFNRFSTCRGPRSIKWCSGCFTIISMFFGFVFKLSRNRTKVPLGKDDLAILFQKQHRKKTSPQYEPIAWYQQLSFPQFETVEPFFPSRVNKQQISISILNFSDEIAKFMSSKILFCVCYAVLSKNTPEVISIRTYCVNVFWYFNASITISQVDWNWKNYSLFSFVFYKWNAVCSSATTSTTGHVKLYFSILVRECGWVVHMHLTRHY